MPPFPLVSYSFPEPLLGNRVDILGCKVGIIGSKYDTSEVVAC